MLIEKWRPVLAPEVEGGAEPEGGTPPPATPELHDGPGSGRGTLRKQLEQSVAAERTSRERTEREEEDRDRKGRFVRGKSRPAQGEQIDEEETPEEVPAEVPTEGEEPVAAAAVTPDVAAPEGWAREAKAEWGNLSPVVQAAVDKREKDMAKGVEELKQRYSELDKVLGPRMDIIRSHGHTPAQAVNQLWSWFEALNANPKVAFPALAQSFKFDLRQLLGEEKPAPAATALAAGTEPAQPEGDLPPGVQTYINKLQAQLGELSNAVTQRFGALENTFAEQSQAKTNEILSQWAKDKPYFEEVRNLMAHLIGSGAVPELPGGSTDLDKAYDMALYASPEIRAKVLATQQATADKARKDKEVAERKAQQQQADKARRAGVSLTGGAPGTAVAAAQQKGASRKSVAESIRESIEQLSD